MGAGPDRTVLPLTRGIALALVAVLLLAVGGLYGWPGDTEDTFAWTINPDATPLLMGAGYASGVVFFWLVATRGRRWLEVSFGFVGVGVFATLMGIATIIHWDRFNHDHPTFWAWVALYAVTPLLVPALWLGNGGYERARAGDSEERLPAWARLALGVGGGGFFLAGLIIFVRPSIAVDHWPWDVTPLTARVVASFTALNVGWAVAALDGRWAAIRIPAVSQLVGFLLLLVGLLRARDDLDTGSAATWVYVGIIAALVCLLAWLLVRFTAPAARPSPGRS